MIKGLEFGVPQGIPWLDRVFSHFATSKTGLHLSFGEQEEYREKLRANIDEITTVPVDEFLEELIRFGNDVCPIGQDGIRREGLFFGLFQPDHTRLVKLFGGCKLDRQFVTPLLQQLYPQEQESIRFMGIRSLFKAPTTPDRARQKLMSGFRNEARCYSSAEIAVRTIAHTVLPKQMPIPKVIIDRDLESVGFYLDHEAAFSTALPWNPALPGEAIDLRNTLMPYNVHIYEDTADQVLLARDGRVLNFSRLDYGLI